MSICDELIQAFRDERIKREKKELTSQRSENCSAVVPFEYWFSPEDGETAKRYITRCWNFDSKYGVLVKDYYEFKDWDWDASYCEIKDRGSYIFVYRNYDLTKEIVPDYENKDIYTEINPKTT
jgi:hypothetical protein